MNLFAEPIRFRDTRVFKMMRLAIAFGRCANVDRSTAKSQTRQFCSNHPGDWYALSLSHQERVLIISFYKTYIQNPSYDHSCNQITDGRQFVGWSFKTIITWILNIHFDEIFRILF